jgi:hypothetical protein
VHSSDASLDKEDACRLPGQDVCIDQEYLCKSYCPGGAMKPVPGRWHFSGEISPMNEASLAEGLQTINARPYSDADYPYRRPSPDCKPGQAPYDCGVESPLPAAHPIRVPARSQKGESGDKPTYYRTWADTRVNKWPPEGAGSSSKILKYLHNIEECMPIEACIGGDLCKHNYIGLRCAKCRFKYYRRKKTSTCVEKKKP